MNVIEKRVEVLRGIQRAFDKFTHHDKLSAELVNDFETAMKEELPGYRVHFDRAWDTKAFRGFLVTGNGLSLSDQTEIVFVWGGDAYLANGSNEFFESNWKAIIQELIDAADPSDYLERLRQESVLEPDLCELEAKAKRLEEELQKVRQDALNSVAKAPVPSCAIARKDPSFWEKPSVELTQKFPALFGSCEPLLPGPSRLEVSAPQKARTSKPKKTRKSAKELFCALTGATLPNSTRSTGE
jgi:hypothetical protein